MTVYQNCKVGDVQAVILHSGDGHGYGFSILSGNSRPRRLPRGDDADQARACVAKVVEKAVEIMPQGRRIALRGVPPAPFSCGQKGTGGEGASERGVAPSAPSRHGDNARSFPFRAFAAAHAEIRDGTRPALAF